MSVRLFAKVFERDGDQVLVYRDENDEGAPDIVFMFKGNDVALKVRIGFNQAKSADDVDQRFGEVDEAMAFNVRAKALENLGDLLEGRIHE